MATTDVITDADEFSFVLELLSENCGVMAHNVSYLSFLWALRVGDLLTLRWSSIEKAIIEGKFVVIERKTKKINVVYLNSHSKDFLVKMRRSHPCDIYLFQSRYKRTPKPISVKTTYYWIKKVEKHINERRSILGKDSVNLGTHTMRKVAARMRYDENKDLAAVQQLLNHTDPKTTIRYLGLGDQEKRKVYDSGSEIAIRNQFSYY